MKRSTLLLMVLCIVTIQLSAQQKKPQKEKENQRIAAEPSSISLENLIKQPSSVYVITKQHVSSISGIRHVYIRQAINGLEVYGTESSVHIDKNGKVLMEHNKFLKDVQVTVKSSSQGISARQAVTSVASQMGYTITNLQEVKSIGGKNKATVFNKAGISSEEIPAKLMYYYREGIGTYLVWELSVAEKNSSDWWNFRVDASTGKIIDKDNWTISCNILGDHEDHVHTSATPSAPFIGPMNEPVENNAIVSESFAPPAASYRVYAMPVENPNYGTRTLVTNPENLTASPFGWHDTNGDDTPEFTNTRGNNVDAYDDDNANNNPDGKYAFSPGGNLIFDFPLNTTYSAGDQSENAAITNLFYWTNIIHDVTYQYGFDEASGNFQQNNYGNGGLGNDPVNAEAQDGSGTCNANFGTPADGSRPRMQMYVCNSRDGDLDNMVIIHEYGHGISNRLSTLGGAEQMGEGWSDYYGLMLTMESGDAGPDSRGVGTWLIGEGPGGPGIRTWPYSTDFGVNPHTYDDIKTEVAPHGVGSVWAEMLWEMTWELIAIHGFDTDFYNGNGGNNISLALVTEGLKLQPSQPGFVDGRDAILAADMAMYGGANQCAIWEAFARRGLGYSAIQGSSGSKTDGTEAFDLPPSFSSLDVIDEVCLSDGIQTGLSGGNPTGGVYSGSGVTDDGNGMTFTFDPSVGGPGLVTVTYIVNDFCTGAPTTLTDDINVTNDPPEIICMGSGTIPMNGTQTSTPGAPIPDNNPTGVTVNMNVTENVTITDLDVNLNISHTWVGDVIVTIKSPSGTMATIIDRPGRTTSGFGCSGDNIVAVLDDEAATAVENECAGSVPTINGSFIPNNPLSVFDGESTMGLWELTVSDVVSPDAGTINSWGIDYDYEVTAPVLDVTLDGSGNATVNAEDLLFSVSVDCGGYTVLAGSPLAPTVSFTCSDTGLNTVAVEVTNDNGATSTCSALVNVIGGGGGGGPFTCPGNITQDNDPGICGAVVTYTVQSPSGCGGATPITFTYTGAPEVFIVPAGVTEITVENWGASGADGDGSGAGIGGLGGYASGVLSVTPGDVINIFVGGQDGYNGGGMVPGSTAGNGGGASDIRINGVTLADRVLVAAGGGGGGSTGCVADWMGGNGGNGGAGDPGIKGVDSPNGGGGFGGSLQTGGAPGIGCAGFLGGPGGDDGTGGVGQSCCCATIPNGGGGGGGYNVGGGGGGGSAGTTGCSGNDKGGGGGGGGGLSYIGGVTNGSINNGVNSGNGMIVISYINTGTVTQTAGLASGDIFPVGTTTNTFEYDDGVNPVQTCSFDVTINDTEAPAAVCQNITVQLDASGNASIIPADVDGGSTDNCGIASLSVSPSTFTCANVGANNVTFTVTDVNGNSNTCTAVVTVEDNVAPAAVCQNITVQLDASGNASITPADVDGGSTDNCGIASLSVSPSTFTCANVGANNVTFTVTDVNGNSSTCTAVVTVEDNVAPAAVCQNITVQLDATGNVSITAGDVDGGSTDACGIASTSIDITDFTCADIGPNNVTLTVTDVNGNSSTCVAVVTVEDDLPPTIVCPENITANTDLGMCSAVVSFPMALGQDNCSVTVSQTGGLASGSAFPVGVNTVEFTATDGSGNTAVCSFTITVVDNEVPTMVCQNITIQLDASGNASITAADVDGGSTDNCGIASISVSPSTFDCSDVGDNPVVLTVTDVNGNSNTCTAIVTVEDITPPVAVCQNITVELDPVTGTVTIAGTDIDGGSTDACGIDTYNLDIDTFDCSNIGDNTVVLTVTDVNGNISTCTAIVTVEDNTNPELVCQDFTLELGADGTATLDPNDVIASNTDNCVIATVAVDITEFSCADIGTPVTVQVFTSDVNGNLSTCTAVVTVVDLLAPVLTCPTDQTVDPGAGNLFYIVPDYFATGEATAIDNCTDPVTSTTQDPAAGTPLSDGVYTITLTAEDEYGNVSTCTFELTVESVLGAGDNNANIGSLEMYPNPAQHTVTIGNPQSLSLEKLSIFDLRGRMVKSIDLRSMGAEKTIDISEMAAATYLVIIQGENGQTTKRLIKE
ncbi:MULTISPECIES: M36 family metallopeptidase [Aequorivita]|uniref:M36 family metallopeptidase n=1 Tax=Aequorivita iocasae TaxID=2803865 RepID=A0ABX7DQB0_9FLAO|nr:MULTISPECIES: M36 family metallopeptidase [Aequorivita]QQX75632.1 M36 family metallopeptidase [Aequorivita iocasae]UCA55088.1 M36 family metallopeptidase [Aequorivita sp. F7]